MDNQNLNQEPTKQKRVSKWLEDAHYRQLNKKWLGYSGEIAMRILALIEDDKNLNQKKLAEALNVSPQYINRVIQGRENLTLETIGKLSDILNFELIAFPPYRYQKEENTIPADGLTEGKIIDLPSRFYSSANKIPVAQISIGNA